MIIPIFRVIASSFPVDSDTGDIEAGMCVGLETNASSNTVIRLTEAGGTVNNTVTNCIGLAGDRKRASEAYEWENRVSDNGDETAGSGMMTVYHGGGEFWVDVDDSSIRTPTNLTTITGVVSSAATVAVGGFLYPANDNGGTRASGQLDSTQEGTDPAVAMILSDAVTIESGIPGEFEPGSSVDYVDPASPRTWVQIKLLI